MKNMLNQKIKHKVSLMSLAIIALAVIAVLGLSFAAYMNPTLFRASGGMSGGYGGNVGYTPNPDGDGGLPGGLPGLPGGVLTNPRDLINQIRKDPVRGVILQQPRQYTAPAAVCGNGNVQSGEACDDGNTAAGDYCSADCKTVTGRCGDSAIQSNETCDDGNATAESCLYGQTSCQVCDATCHLGAGVLVGRCGDGAWQSSNELCDGANLGGQTCDTVTYGTKPSGTLACNPNCISFNATGCSVPTVCGNGVREGAEVCDDGTLNGTYGKCKADCTGPGIRCGDNTVNGSEACDGTDLNGKTCVTEKGVGSNGAVSCSASCTLNITACSEVPRCGDGSVNKSGETCDEGALNNTPNHCNATCNGTTASVCGNSVTEAGETCDDGNTTAESCAYGSQSCQVCGSSCQMVSGAVSGYCGDTTVQTTNGEACDGTNLNSQTCSGATSGAKPNGTLACNASCQLDVSACAAYSITNCPSTVLAGYTAHTSAHRNAKIFASGGTTYSWALAPGDTATVQPSGNSVRLIGLDPGQHTLTLNGSVACGPFTVAAYTSGDVTTANSLASVNWLTCTADTAFVHCSSEPKAYTPLALLLYDWNGDGTITANACPPAPSGVVKSDKIGIYGLTTATTADDGANCP